MSTENTHRKCAVTGLTQSVARVTSAPPEEPLLQRFDRYFEVIEASTPELIEHAHAIRYRVYCEETHFLKAAKDANGLEKDDFECHSVNCLLIHSKSRTQRL